MATTREVTVLVKDVYAPEDSQQLTLAESLSVRALKELLQRALPDHPLPSQQRLIFAGKICDDQQTLQAVLAGHTQERPTAGGDDERCEQAPFVFHLMVTSSQPRRRTSTPPPPAKMEDETPSAQATETTPSIATPAPPVAPAPAGHSVSPSTPTPTPIASPAHPSVPLAPWHFGLAPMPPPPAPAGPANAASQPQEQQQQQQFHQQQQLFHQAFLMQQQIMILAQIQYLQQLKAHHEALARAPPSQPATPLAGNVAHNPFAHLGFGGGGLMGGPHAAQPMAHHGVHHAVGGQYPAPAAAPAAAAAAPAAAAPPAQPAEPRGALALALREVMPLVDLRLAFKMAFMLFIIGQDAPQDRLIILGLMSFIGYLHTTGILAKLYEIYVRLSGANANANAEANANANANADRNGNDAPGAAGAEGDGQDHAAPQGIARLLRISPDRGFFQDVRNFLAGFFLSLAPFWYPQPLHGAAPGMPREQPAMPDDFPLQGI
ncbi:hypothetical protein P43SY_001131 [Pythium insidiosum]|uniref:Ubiquitin-like domain-containing protein n=1 Tax=Pythium insidiosum TaxID=114742 RepID=A0AAD5LN49_PYTIN|nr:hypothetical protein P43SY_001131 [Pythium insidiosum]